MTIGGTPGGELTMRATAAGALEQEQSRTASARFGWLSRVRWPETLGLAGVLLLATVLDFFQLSRNGFANTYYAAAVRSMSESWHNFFFSSFDPGGFVTIDKPPVGFWFQVLSVKLFGFQGVSLLLPQALAGVLSVALVFSLVRRRFGSVAALLAALALAVTPISVATNRNNTIDGLLALTLVLAAWAATLAVERGPLGWLLLSMGLVGVGFNIKMAEAFVALPAFVVAYFLAAPLSWRTRIVHLALAGVVLAVVSLSWVTTVDLIPASQRPYVGSSQHNSELELAIGYNGINRLFPRRFFRGVRPVRPSPAPGVAASAGGQGSASAAVAPRTPPAGFAPPGFRGGATGWSTLLRLFSQELAGQLSWLIPLAIFGLVAAAWQMGRAWRCPSDSASLQASSNPRELAQVRGLLLWGGWFLSGFLLFSLDQAARPYYMVTMAPATAALVGIGGVALWHAYRGRTLLGWLLPLALLATAALQVLTLRPFADWSGRLTPPIVILSALTAATLVVARLLRRGGALPLLAAGAATVGMLGLFIAPTVWAAITVGRAAPGGIPSAGPATAGFGFFAGRAPAGDRRAVPDPNAQVNVDPKLLSYLQSNRGDARFLVATPNAQAASPMILKTGDPVMALGGFMGADPILTPETLAQDVKDGVVRFFLMPGVPGSPAPAATGATDRGGSGNGFSGERSIRPTVPSFDAPSGASAQEGPFPGFFGRANGLESWVTGRCVAIPAEAWRSTSAEVPGFGFGFGGGQQLYDCASAASGA